MGKRAEQLLRLKELREELIALTRRSISALTDIAKIQLRVQQLTEQLGERLASAKGRIIDGNASPDPDALS